MDVDPALAGAGSNGSLKRKLEDNSGEERGAPSPRLNMAQDAPGANATANGGPPQGPPQPPSMPSGPDGDPNHMQGEPRTPDQRSMHVPYDTPLSDDGRPLQIETSGRKVTIACENW
jgi:hypothetical protein